MAWPVLPRLARTCGFGALVFLGVFAICLGASAVGPSLRVIDGDTLEDLAGRTRVRIVNIDTPEIHEPGCAAEARLGRQARRMSQQILNGAERIEVRRIGRRDRYGRDLAYVRADGRDLGESLIAAGLARPWTGRRLPWCRSDGSVRL